MKTIVVSVLSLAIGFSIGLNVHYLKEDNHSTKKSSNDTGNYVVIPRNKNGHWINLDNIKELNVYEKGSSNVVKSNYRFTFTKSDSITKLLIVPYISLEDTKDYSNGVDIYQMRMASGIY